MKKKACYNQCDEEKWNTTENEWMSELCMCTFDKAGNSHDMQKNRELTHPLYISCTIIHTFLKQKLLIIDFLQQWKTDFFY